MLRRRQASMNVLQTVLIHPLVRMEETKKLRANIESDAQTRINYESITKLIVLQEYHAKRSRWDQCVTVEDSVMIKWTQVPESGYSGASGLWGITLRDGSS